MFKLLIPLALFALASARPDVSHLIAGSDFYLPQPDPRFGSAIYRPSGFLDYRTNTGPGGVIKIKRPVVKTGKPIVSKAFYVHTASNDDGPKVQYEDVEYTVNPRIHYNIIFAKAPTADGGKINLNNVAVAPENQEKTIVYVLSGDNAPFDVNSDAHIDLPRPAPPSSPELVFVKYNEEGDIKGAVKHIQDHYNQQHAQNVQDFNILGAEKKIGYNYGINPPLLREEGSGSLGQILEPSVDVYSDDNIELPRSDPASPGVVYVKYNNDDDIKGTIETIQNHYNKQHAQNVQDFNILGAEKKIGYNYGITPPLLKEEGSGYSGQVSLGYSNGGYPPLQKREDSENPQQIEKLPE